MKNLILFELKRMLRSLKYWLVVAIILLFGLIMIQEFKGKIPPSYEVTSEIILPFRSFFTNKLNGIKGYWTDPTRFGYYPDFTTDKIAQSEQLYEDLVNRTYILEDALSNKNWQEVNEQLAYIQYEELHDFLEKERLREKTGEISRYYGLFQELKGLRVKYQYPEWVVDPYGNLRDHEWQSITFMQKFKYYKWLKEINHEPLHRYSMNSSTFLYHFMNHYLKWILAILMIILLYDIFGKDQENGSVKFLFSQPISRMKVILSKSVAGLLSCVLAVLIPVCIIVGLYSIRSGFSSMQYPVLIQRNSMTVLNGIQNTTILELEKWGYNHALGISLYSGFPIEFQDAGMDLSLHLVSLWKFLLMALAMLVVYLAFVVMLNVMLSSIFRKKVLALSISLFITVVGTALSFTEFSDISALNPFWYSNPVAILGGTGDISGLQTILVLGGYVLILFICTYYFVSKQDI